MPGQVSSEGSHSGASTAPATGPAGSASHCFAEGSLHHTPPQKSQHCLGTTRAVLDLTVLGHMLTKGFLCVRMAPGQARPFLLLLMAWHQLGQDIFYGSCSAFTALKLAMDRARPVPCWGSSGEGRPALTPHLTPTCHWALIQVPKGALKMGWNLGKSPCRG